MTRAFASLVAALALTVSVAGQTFDTRIYTLIAQRPDAAGAVDVALTDDFLACCSAFSGSAAPIVFPVEIPHLVEFAVILTARSPADAARLRAHTYVPADSGACCVMSRPETFPEVVSPTILAPRLVRQVIDPRQFALRPDGEWWWLVEFRGRPLVYGASLRVVQRVP